LRKAQIIDKKPLVFVFFSFYKGGTETVTGEPSWLSDWISSGPETGLFLPILFR
jgi:hypothetical protein